LDVVGLPGYDRLTAAEKQVRTVMLTGAYIRNMIKAKMPRPRLEPLRPWSQKVVLEAMAARA